MDVVDTARGRVYSCECGKVIPFRTKKVDDEPEELEEVIEESEEAKAHRKKLRRARAEHRRKERGFVGVIDDHLLYVVFGVFALWILLGMLMVLVKPLGIPLIIFGLMAVVLTEMVAPTSMGGEGDGNRAAMFGPAGLILIGLMVVKVFILMVHFQETWRALLLLLCGLGMIVTGGIGLLVWLT